MEMQMHMTCNTGNRLRKRNLIIGSEEQRQNESQKQKWQDRKKNLFSRKEKKMI